MKTNLRDINIAAGQNSREREYWISKLEGELSKTAFPIDRLKKSCDRRAMKDYKFEISGDYVDVVNKIANNSDVRLFVILLANLMILLNKYTGRTDILLGTSIYKQDFEGDFINTILAIREILKKEQTFKQLLISTGKTIFEANENQNYPIDSLLYQLEKLGEQGENLLFDIGIILTNIHKKEYLSRMDFNLIFSFTRSDKGIYGTIQYNSGLYRKDSISVLVTHYTKLLENALFNLDAPVSGLSIIGEYEKNKILNEFNNTAIDTLISDNLVDLFEAQVSRTPGNIAVIFNKQSLTYDSLNKKSNQLAKLLRNRGIGPESVVGLLLDHSLETAIAIMAILKSGGAYLPINPDYPDDRINFILFDSKATILLTQPEYRNINFQGEVILVNDETIYCGDDTDLSSNLEPGNLAYVIYTSGSTGNPKGVMVEHKNLLNYLNSFFNEFEITDSDTVIQVSSYSFDAFVEEFYPVLLRGGTLAIPGKNVVMDLQALVAFINDNHGTLISCSPLLLNELNLIKERTSIKTFISGGDVLKDNYIQYLMEYANVYNTYGPTESTVCATYYKCRSGSSLNYIPIGKPIGNYNVFILDSNNEISPLNVSGQLCVSGEGITRGYLNMDELTGEKFIENPFIPGEKLYTTGDLARWLPDGNIEFIGRIDNQVKIRGYRIEPGEIESKLLSYPSVKEAFVIVHEDETNDKYLCGYIISDRPQNISDLKKYLSGLLPFYMIPAYIIQLDKLPVNNHGKIDKKNLPDPKLQFDENALIAPIDEMERTLIKIWADVLGIHDREISTMANFFDLGGHSLKATRLALKIFKEFNARMPVMEVFNYPTIKEIANYIKSSNISDYWSIKKANTQDHYPLASAQKRIFIVNQLYENTNTYNMTGAMMIEGPLVREKMEEALKGLIERHEAFRTSFAFYESEPVQILHDKVTFGIDYYEASNKSIHELINSFISPIDISIAPLLKVKLVKIEAEKYLLLFDTHHIIADGASFDIIINDFISLYRGEELLPLKLQYKDYAVWQNKLQGGHLSKQENYWLNQFKGTIPVLNIPTDFLKTSDSDLSGGRIWFQPGQELSAKIKSLASQTETTVFMVLFSVYAILLSRYSGQEDLIVGSPVVGRPHVDLENIVGMFVNMLPIRIYPVPEYTFLEFLYQIKKSTLNAQDNQDYQFEDLVEKLKIPRKDRNPLFNCVFSLENFELANNFNFDNLSFSRIEFNTKVTKFDLSLLAFETDKEIKFELVYLKYLFKKSTVKKISRHYTEILTRVVRDVKVKIKDINLQDDLYTVIESQVDSGDFNF